MASSVQLLNLRKYVPHHPKCLAVVRECRSKMKDFAEPDPCLDEGEALGRGFSIF
jgi:hypothetical protein